MPRWPKVPDVRLPELSWRRPGPRARIMIMITGPGITVWVIRVAGCRSEHMPSDVAPSQAEHDHDTPGRASVLVFKFVEHRYLLIRPSPRAESRVTVTVTSHGSLRPGWQARACQWVTVNFKLEARPPAGQVTVMRRQPLAAAAAAAESESSGCTAARRGAGEQRQTSY